LEKADSDSKIFDLILNPHALNNRLENPIRQGTPLIKAHGDIFTLNCPKCDWSLPLPKVISSENAVLNNSKHCPRDRTDLELPMRLPDSAREGSKEFISILDKLAERNDIGILVCIGFSGNYDVHVVDMIKKFKYHKVLIYNIDPEPSALVGILPPSCHLKIDADKILGNVLQEINRCKIDSGLDLDFVDEFFDPIYKLVRITKIEQEICYSEPFRRLQGIHQLGIKYCKFIGANHNRFEHSICVMQQADTMYLNLKRINANNETIRNILDPRRNKIERQFLRLAALLHDIGHLSFGHLTEEILTELTGKQYHHDLDLTQHILDMLRESIRPNDHRDDPLPIEGNYYTWDDLFNLIIGKSGINILDKLIKSTFDADKIEYLTRDSMMTGANYGNKLDISILLDNLLITENESLVVGHEAVSVLEAISEARYHMNVEVYYNIDVRCYETLLKKLLKEWISKTMPRDAANLEKNLFRNDQWILNELEDYYKKSEGVEDELSINRKIVNIIKGEAPLPKRILVELEFDNYEKSNSDNRKSESISGEEIIEILKNIKRDLECTGDLFDLVLCDTYDFDPYKKEEEPGILIKQYDIYNRTVSFQEEKLSECSKFIGLLSSISRNLEYKIRIYILEDKDDSVKNRIVDLIKSMFNTKGIDQKTWRIKEYD
jgi:HD superfamily phosphohydrolase